MNAVIRIARNDARAVAPYLMAAGAVVVLAALADGRAPLMTSGIVAWYLGTMAIGATVVGHEFVHRTHGLLMAQPVRRGTVLAAKLLVALLAITVLAATTGLAQIGLKTGDVPLSNVTLALVGLVGLSVAPLVTVLTRSALAGVGVAAATPLLSLSLAAWLRPDAASEFELLWLSGQTTIAVCGLAGIALMVVVTRWLEDREVGARPIYVTSSQHLVPRRWHRSRLWQLTAKELHLQQLPLAVAGLYLAAVVVAWLSDGRMPFPADARADHLGYIYGSIQAVLIGAIASAEERQSGVLTLHVALPMSAGAQFLVKTAVALGLCLVLTIAVPSVLATTLDHPNRYAPGGQTMVYVAALTLGGLWVSSWSRSSLLAFLVAPVIMVTMYFPVVLTILASDWLLGVLRPAFDSFAVPVSVASIRRLGVSLVVVAACGLAALVWWMALEHHRREVGTWRGVVRDLVAVFGYTAAASATIALIFGLVSPFRP